MLRTVGLVAEAGMPVLGVNVGQLGYLTEVEPAELSRRSRRSSPATHGIEERMLVAVRVDAETELGPVPHAVALNEAVLEKTPMGHTVRLAVHIDGDFFTTYAADGLIVATPTGSTAYSFSARARSSTPTYAALLLTPVSPHMLFDRTLVLEPDIECGSRCSGTGRRRCRSTAATRRAPRGRRRRVHASARRPAW